MFSVEPWEMQLGDDVLDEFHIIERNGERWQLGTCSTQPDKHFYFKREDGPLLCLPTTIESTRVDNKWEVSEELLRATFEDYLTHNKWIRVFQFESATQLRSKDNPSRYQLFLSPQGQGYWQHFHARYYPHVSVQGGFFWSGSSDFLLNANGEAVLERLNTEPTKSRWDYARACLDFDKNQLWDEIWAWKNGDREAFSYLLKGALISQDELWQGADDHALYLDFVRQEKVKHMRASGDDYAWVPVIPALQHAVQRAMEHFGPHVISSKVEEHLCLSELLKRLPWILKIDAQDLSAHERLEAAIQWREWLASTREQSGGAKV